MKKNLVLLFTLLSVSTISLSACNKQEGQGGGNIKLSVKQLPKGRITTFLIAD